MIILLCAAVVTTCAQVDNRTGRHSPELKRELGIFQSKADGKKKTDLFRPPGR